MQISEYCRPKGMPLNHTKLGIVVTDYSWQAYLMVSFRPTAQPAAYISETE